MAGRRGGFDGSPGQLRVARRGARVAGWRFDGRAVHGDPGITADVEQLHRAAHHAECDFPFCECNSEVLMRGAPSRRTVAMVVFVPASKGCVPAQRIPVRPARSAAMLP